MEESCGSANGHDRKSITSVASAASRGTHSSLPLAGRAGKERQGAAVAGVSLEPRPLGARLGPAGPDLAP